MDSFSDHLALLIDRGGYVMVPLLALSVVSLALVIERIWFWVATHRPGRVRRLARLNDALRLDGLHRHRIAGAEAEQPAGDVAVG
ncbi:MAG: hypothetical protein SYC29_18250 [Planctomycetota bacterium]|nr:hypothetical protein [Planctomycetota bacterium]